MLQLHQLEDLKLFGEQDILQNPKSGIWSYEQIKPVTFIHGCNLSFLRWIKENMMKGYFHIGIVDPPYGIDVTKMCMGQKDNHTRSYERGNWDGEVPTEEYWELLKYACRHLVVWGGNYFSHNIPAGRCFVVWDKMNDKMSFAAGELALTTIDKNAMIIRRPRNKGSEDEDSKDRRHDTQKPVYLYDFIHLNLVERGWRVLDTHGGSFSHAVAAGKNNIDLTIMDKCKSYVETGIDVYKRSTVKGRLAF